jgi:hypothetical protein
VKGCDHFALAAVMEITPLIASEMLDGASNFRKTTPSRVAFYSNSMADNYWEVNWESLKFDDQWRNSDGQHRLLGCIKSKTPFTTLVIVGVKNTSEIDRAQARRFSQTLQNAGYKNAVALSGVANMCYVYETQGNKGWLCPRYPSSSRGIEYVRENRGIEDAVRIVQRCKKLCPIRLIGSVTWLGIKLGHFDLDTAGDFIDVVSGHTYAEEFDPRLVLHKRLAKNAVSKMSLPQRDMLATLIKVWNLYVTRRTATANAIRWRAIGNAPEPFPAILTENEIRAFLRM